MTVPLRKEGEGKAFAIKKKKKTFFGTFFFNIVETIPTAIKLE